MATLTMKVDCGHHALTSPPAPQRPIDRKKRILELHKEFDELEKRIAYLRDEIDKLEDD